MPQYYQPISIIPIFSKIFDSLMYNQWSHFLNLKLYSLNVSSVSSGKVNHLSSTQYYWSLCKLLEEGSLSPWFCVISVRLLTVFSLILLQKLSFYSIHNSSFKLIQSYLSDRVQYVSVKSSCSKMKAVETGVPQDSSWAFFLYSLYYTINDLPLNLKCTLSYLCHS